MKKILILLCLFSFTILASCSTFDNMVKAMLKQDKPGDTKRAVYKLRHGEPEPAYPIYDKGVAFAIKGDFKSAKIEFSKIKRENRLYQSAVASNKVIQDAILKESMRDVVIQYFKADMQIHNRKFAVAIIELDKCIKLNPRYTKAYLRRGSTNSLIRQDVRALSDYNKAIELDPKYSDAYYSRGRLFMKKNKMEHALLDFNKAIKFSGHPKAYMSRSELYARNGKYSNAVNDAKKAIKADPKNFAAYNILGYASKKQNNKSRACKSYRNACNLGSCSGIEENRRIGYCN